MLTLFTLLSAVGTLGIMVLMAIASLSVTAYFAARRRLGLRRLVLPMASLLALAGISLFAALHFELLAGGPSWSARWLPWLIPVAALVGIGLRRSSEARDARRIES